MAHSTQRDADRIRQAILAGRVPTDLGPSLDLSDVAEIERLPAGLAMRQLNLSGCAALTELPDDLRVDVLNVTGCTRLRAIPPAVRPRVLVANDSGLESLPPHWKCYELQAAHTPLAALPEGFEATCKIDLSNCRQLEHLPPGLTCGSLNVRGCSALRALPEGLDLWFLNIQDCTRLSAWPRQANLRTGHLNLSGCLNLTSLPDYLTQLATLDVSGCVSLTELPGRLRVALWIDVGGSGLKRVPPTLAHVPLRWKGVLIDDRVAFRPETIAIEEILSETNAERRRVLIERVGYEWFLDRAKAEVRDRDTDPGGPRSLLCVPLAGDEDLVCLSVLCPSTARRYLIRVPPQMTRCHQAAAWIAGYDDPADYQPVIET